ncbi:MAG: Rrf2 family transcriptional regulator [Ignavibacteriae bacterium]|nr:MAG: Rrf2 family transcriptional regulator [Ignavibacteriota bacterium]
MSIIFSRQCEYALQAVSYLALQPAGKKTSIRELTKKLKIPYHFLAKILQDLTYKKLLVSQKGPSGGFALAQSPDQITLFHIVEAIDGSDFAHKCVMGFPECSGKNPCSIHHQWAKMRDEIYSMLVTENITEMAREMKKPEYRL